MRDLLLKLLSGRCMYDDKFKGVAHGQQPSALPRNLACLTVFRDSTSLPFSDFSGLL